MGKLPEAFSFLEDSEKCQPLNRSPSHKNKRCSVAVNSDIVVSVWVRVLRRISRLAVSQGLTQAFDSSPSCRLWSEDGNKCPRWQQLSAALDRLSTIASVFWWQE